MPSGECQGVSNDEVTCTNDGNACTRDECLAGSCTHPPIANGGNCDDGSPCKECQGGSCIARANGTTCTGFGENPDNPCTSDICFNGGCQHQCFVDGHSCSPPVGGECLTFQKVAGKPCACVKPPTPGPGCGPDPHWGDSCLVATDLLDSTALLEVDLDFDYIPDLSLALEGQLVVDRSAAKDDSDNFPGTRPIDGHLDVIDTEILYMVLGDGLNTLTVGGGRGDGGQLDPTLGAIAELPGDPTQGDAFFDVFFEMELEVGGKAYNQAPVRVEAILDRVPAVAAFAAGSCIPLFSSPVPGEGVPVGNLILVNHSVSPAAGPINVPTMSYTGLAGLALLLGTAGGVIVWRRRRLAYDDWNPRNPA